MEECVLFRDLWPVIVGVSCRARVEITMEGDQSNSYRIGGYSMRRILSVFLISVLFGLAPGISAQGPPADTGPAGEQESGFTLGQNYPNPFNPETRIPFDLLEVLFTDGATAVVSVRIYNVLQQFIASPVALSHPSGRVPLVDLEYMTPGRYEAYWDGLDQSGREVASGIYFVQLTVNGVTAVMRMYVAK